MGINNINKTPQRTWSAVVACDAIEKPNSFICLKNMMLFSLATGLRQSNIMELTWSKIDMNKKEAWI